MRVRLLLVVLAGFVSMALAGPLAEVVPLEAIFIAAGVIPLFLGAIAYVVARMPRDEIAHPLDD